MSNNSVRSLSMQWNKTSGRCRIKVQIEKYIIIETNGTATILPKINTGEILPK